MESVWFYLLVTALPLYVANASAMIFGGKTPLDGNVPWSDGRPLLGKGKTWKGTFMGILCGTFIGLLLWNFFPTLAGGLTPHYPSYAFLLSLGAIAGDMAGSFLKRRWNMQRGHPAPMLDQLDFVAGGVILAALVYIPTLLGLAVLVAITPIVHQLSNRLAFSLKLKSVPW